MLGLSRHQISANRWQVYSKNLRVILDVKRELTPDDPKSPVGPWRWTLKIGRLGITWN